MIEHRFRQSWLNTVLACPEQARTIRNKTAVDTEGSKRVRGTAVHAAIEAALSARMAGHEMTTDDILEAFHWSWDSLVDSIQKWNKGATTAEATVGTLTTTIEEKSNKVMEVLLSAVSPTQLMAGKIFGQAAVAALMLVMFGGIIIAGLIALALSNILSVQLILLSLAYFVIAYFTIATVMAAIGSAVSELRDAQALMTPVIVVLMMPLVLYIPINNNPTSTLAVVTSMIPPLTPFVMPLRLAASPEPLPAWEIIASLLIGVGSVVCLLWITSRIFRVGVLMQGKPPSPMELLRWMRYR